MPTERLSAELAAAETELKRHMGSWEHAFRWAGPVMAAASIRWHWATRAHTQQLLGRCRDRRARLNEHQA
jgi:hypothetical protein